jgi:hypothetical protein
MSSSSDLHFLGGRPCFGSTSTVVPTAGSSPRPADDETDARQPAGDAPADADDKGIRVSSTGSSTCSSPTTRPAEPLTHGLVFDTASAALLTALGTDAMPDVVVATARGAGLALTAPATN